jgi:hypothetical protein
MNVVYICSRFTGDIDSHIDRATSFSQFVYSQGYLPMCVHIFLDLATGLSEYNGDRLEILTLGLEYLKLCDEIWVLDIDGISDGMSKEINLARTLGKDVRYITKIDNRYSFTSIETS